MDEFTIRLLFLGVGVIVGWALGLLHSMNRYAKRTRDNTEYCRAVIQRRLDREGDVAPPPHATESTPLDQPDYTRLGPLAPKRDERGAVNMTTVGMFIAIGFMVLTLFSTLNTNQELGAQAKIRDNENTCTSAVLFDTVDALNQRTEFSGAQAEANIALQNAQLKFLSVLSTKPPAAQADFETALDDYLTALSEFNRVVSRSADKSKDNPYPTQEQYAACLKEAREG